MGMRIHVLTEFKMECKELPFLNYKSEEFKSLLEALDCNVFTIGEGDGSIIEIDVKQFESAVKKLKNFGKLTDDEKSDITHALENCGFTLKECLEMVGMIKKLGQKSDGYYRFMFY